MAKWTDWEKTFWLPTRKGITAGNWPKYIARSKAVWLGFGQRAPMPRRVVRE